MHEQPCSTTMFKLASSTMHVKPVNNTVQAGQLNHVQACQQYCSSWPAQRMFKPVNNIVQARQLNQCSSLSTILFKLGSSTNVQAGQFNHVQACQQHCSSWPAQPMFKLVNNTVQAGQLNHVQACQQTKKKAAAFLRVIAKPCKYLPTRKVPKSSQSF